MREAIAGVLILVAAAVMAVGPAGAGGPMEMPFNITGQVREINEKQAQLFLSDGTQLFAVSPSQLTGIREGQTVQVSGEERFGKKIILRIEPAPPR